ncbi:hypothetical protein IQ251_00055 [Saccharopolyspora sp. HNM0983]|uniref:MYXO-CTERM domain-containing protein n=1 Tax=Saccharopolyspora montiporae TaxID=2781240 RepID=A0A929FZR7_9PSEU|nr:hypothetical protein [Saccharopolyspora sp. HNM0983]MBE9372833.1 hypothetical protein [Saccharopolyspora sp. HNM0983]
MLKAFVRTRGGARAFVMFALSALLACFALPHHSHVATAAPSGGEAAPAAASSEHSTATPSAPEADPDTSFLGGDCEQDSHPEPACHNAEAQVMDLSKRWSASDPDDWPALLGVVVVVLAGGALLLGRTRAQRCWTRPPLRVAGFSLLIKLGVSRT